MATTVSDTKQLLRRTRATESAQDQAAQPVRYWAALGGLICAFWAYILISWVTGPNFERVLPGPTQQAPGMYEAQVAFQILTALLVLVSGYKVIYKPWRDQSRLTTDGAFFIAYLSVYCQDQLSNAGGYWFTYNAYFWNRGSWFPELPWWSTFAQPGATAPEPVFALISGYIYFFVISVFAGMWLMRKSKELWPSINIPARLAIVFVGMMVVDIVIEVFIWLPMGIYTYNWGPGPILNKGAVNQFPLIEAVVIGVMCTTVVSLRYFVDDKGNTLVERGLDKVKAGPLKQAGLRLLAVIAGLQLIFLILYNLPMYGIGVHSKDWPASITSRSYMMDNICGPGTPRVCPTADTPRFMNSPTAISIDDKGNAVIPPGARLPNEIRFTDVAGPHIEIGPTE